MLSDLSPTAGLTLIYVHPPVAWTALFSVPMMAC